MRTTYRVDESLLVSLYEGGMGNREIARNMNLPHHVVGYRLKKLGLVSNVARGLPPERIDDDHSRCCKCLGVVKNDQFPWVQGRADGRRLSYCRKCRSTQLIQNRFRSPEAYFRDKTNRIRKNKDQIPCNLSDNYLVNTWYEQDGKCFYTDEPLILGLGNGRNSWCPSIDRMDNSVGYLEGNVIICGNRINSIKTDLTLEELQKWMPDWHRRIQDKLGV